MSHAGFSEVDMAVEQPRQNMIAFDVDLFLA